MVGDDVDPRIAPAVELADEPSEPFHLQVHVADKRLGVTVPDVIHLVMAEDHEELAQAFRRLGGRFEIANLATVGAEVRKKRESVRPRRGVLVVHCGMNVVALDLDGYLRTRERHQGRHANSRDGG